MIANECYRSSLSVGFYPVVLIEPYGLVGLTIRTEGSPLTEASRKLFFKEPAISGQAGTIAPAPRCAADNSTNRNRPCFSWDVFYCTTVFTGVSPCDPGQHLRMPAALCSDKRNEHYYESAKPWPNLFKRTELSAGPSRCSCLLIGPALLRPPNLSVNRHNTRAVALPCAQRTLPCLVASAAALITQSGLGSPPLVEM